MSVLAHTNKNQSEFETLIAFPYLFEQQLTRTPDNLAIVFEEQRFSYKQLDQLANQFRDAVLQCGILPQSHIGICVDKSPDAIAAMLGIMKAGCAFVPLDPDYPTDRITYMVEDANIQVIIVQPKYQHRLVNDLSKDQNITWIDSYNPLPEKDRAGLLNLQKQVVIEPTDLAYIMYTSGSTGNPKGVQIEHQALATYCYADIDAYQVNELDRTLQFSTINFDIAIEEIFPPLLTGSSIVVRPTAHSNSLNELSTIINDYQVTAVHIATAYWHEWVDLMVASQADVPASLRLMVVTGEKVSTQHYQRWNTLCEKNQQHILWCNAYGPTETTVSATVFIPKADFNDDQMPIGKPLKRYDALIVDENHKIVQEGKTGQLLIGGSALARGYLNRPELNDKAFIDLEYQGRKQRFYKTGDLSRWNEQGDIEFAGRIDHQIKLGSYRIEPGEVEAQINHHPNVLESLVLPNIVENKKSLIAYIAVGNSEISINSVSDFLYKQLPAYMVPARYIVLEKFPKTDNGKIDRKALPDVSQSISPLNDDYVAPRNSLEENITEIWQQVLQIPKVGIHDDFFALGGSSLLAVGVVSRLINKLELELPVRDFFANPTVATLASHINQLLSLNIEDYQVNDDNQSLRNRLPEIKPCFFQSQGGQLTYEDSPPRNLFGIHYQPSQRLSTRTKSHAVLICHPLGHEYSRAYRNLQQLTLQLAQRGFDCFRFDYFATGNSSGESEQLTVDSCVTDIQTAARHIRENSDCQMLSVIGVRAGATLAVQAQVPELDHLILWDPMIDGKRYVQMLEKFHSEALKSMVRFSCVRSKSSTDQLFGHAMSQTKRQSLESLYFQPQQSTRTARLQSIICSKKYLKDEVGCDQLKSHMTHYSCDDDIYWHDSNYTESAFSSPKAFQKIIELLEND